MARCAEAWNGWGTPVEITQENGTLTTSVLTQGEIPLKSPAPSHC